MITVDACVIMPNHFHGVIFIHETIMGADLRVGPGKMEMGDGLEKGEHNYEHIIRSEEDYERIFNIIATNPADWAQDEENR